VGTQVYKGHAELFESIFATAIDGIIAIDEVGIVQSFNPGAERLFGYRAEEVVGQNVRMLMPSPDRERHDGYLSNYRATGQAKIIGLGREVVARHKAGEQVPIHLALSEAVVGNRRLFVGICRDIRELTRTRAEVETVRARNDAVLDTAVDAILTINAHGVVQSFNPAAEKLFGFSKAEVLGQNVKQLMPPDIAAHHDGYLEKTLRTGERKIIGTGREVLAQRKDGSRFPAWLSVSHFRVNHEDFFTGIVRNITELREKEQELHRLNDELSRNVHQTARQLELNNVVRGSKHVVDTLQALLDTMVRQTGAIVGGGYLETDDADGTFVLCASSALSLDRRGRRIRASEGFVGESIKSMSLRLVEFGDDMMIVQTAFGDVTARLLCAVPFVYQDGVIGAVEFGFIDRPEPGMLDYLNTLVGLGGALLGASRDQLRIAKLFEQARAQADQLETANHQLDQWAQELQAQQEELEASNEQLAEQKSRLEVVNEELQRSRSDLSEKAHALETTSRYKSEFLANMSHELRTPLNSILILAKVLAENQTRNLEQEQLESLHVIASSGTDLLNLVNDILDLSKIEAGKLALHPEDVPVAGAIEDLQRQFAAMMKAKGLEFACQIDPSVPATIWTDRLRLLQVLRNLLSNANKFTERGRVNLEVRVAARDASGTASTLEFAVADTGIGIPKDKMALVFQPFQQVDAGLSRKYGGTGLGLSISTSLAEELGGRMAFDSDVGVGSTFKLTLPVRHLFAEHSPPRAVSIRTETAAARSFKAPDLGAGTQTILVVEDDETAQLALRRLIESRGLRVRSATSTEEARDVFKSQTVHGVVLDLGLRTGDGIEFARWLRAAGHRSTPVIVHTGRELNEPEERELRELTQSVIMKGDRSYERLLDEVRLLLHGAPRQQNTTPGRHRDTVFLNRRVLVVDDDLRNIFALRALLTGAGMTVHVAEDGNEALAVYNEVHGIDCVLMDLMMPGMDGLEATRRLRELPGGAEIPIIALTAKAMKEDRQACLDAGASDYMSKPVNNDELLGLMRVWMTR
jgi:PAS domain S-box-containing protein